MSAKLPAAERLRDKTNYGLYCVNIFGSGLNSIKEEFKRQVRTGLRQTVYVLDLDDLQTELDNQPRERKESKANAKTHLINSVLHHIQGCCKDYEIKMQKIKEGLKFDLYQYWLQQSGNSKKTIADKTAKSSGKENIKSKEINPVKDTKKVKIACSTSVIVKKHNKVGQTLIVNTAKYIKDEPILNKLYILILCQISQQFYTDLLRLDLPLEGILNFIPTESNYEIMLGNNKLQNFITTTLESINSSIYKLRQELTLKPVGFFTHKLPVISSHLASKYSREIFDQLTWSVYDIDMLRQQYQKYYYEPFQVTDVEIPENVNLTEMYHLAKSLSIQGGQFQKKSILPTSDADLASIAAYLNSLLSTCVQREDFNEGDQLNSVIRSSKSFATATHITMHNKLVVAEDNKLLLNMLQYTDLNNLQSIYLCCLDYNVFEQYVTLLPPKNKMASSLNNLQFFNTISSLKLPQYVKYYSTADSCSQRITELLKEYDDKHYIQDIEPGYKLYTFKRNYNILLQNEDRFVIPTRLCFRDFTLFQMEEFLSNLIAPEININSLSDIHTKTVEFDETVFVRPNSLKALVAEKEKRSEDKKTKKSETDSNRGRKDKRSTSSSSIIQAEESLGLPSDSELLRGYNLEDTLQEVRHTTSKYYFHQGFVKLYEESWRFADMNKQLTLFIQNATLFCSKPRHQFTGISNNIRLLTKNNISIRILNDSQECSKIVMNYPNGLSVFYHETDCEQVWYCEQTPQNEQKRIYTNCGAIIIFFKSKDLIMIIRYNGEVYKLYQHELTDEEEESASSNLEDTDVKSSKFDDLRSQGDSVLAQTEHYNKQKSQTKNTFKLRSTVDTTVVTKISRNSQKVSSEESLKNSTSTNSLTHYLNSLITYELKFFSSLCSRYGLTYSHLIITTSQGKRINLTHLGEIFEERQCSINEWHNYFANEAYCERSDGVKMIWTLNHFKCFHKNGSVFTTTIGEDGLEAYADDLESQISQSSSHNELLEANELQKIGGHEIQKPALEKLISTLNRSIYTYTETAEEHMPQDTQIMQYKCKSWLMQHPNYAEVYVRRSNISNSYVPIEVFSIDNIRVYSQVDENVEVYDLLRSECDEEVITEDKINKKLLVNVWIGENLHIAADNEGCAIKAQLTQSGAKSSIKSDALSLSLKYTDCIKSAFKYMVSKIAALENGNAQKELEELYFVKKINSDSSIRGFEFFSSLPLTSKYKQRIGNSITELNAVNTLSESLIYSCEEHKEDLQKLFRFSQKLQERNFNNSRDELPQLLSANIYIKIPKQLQSLTNVVKFLEPFENIHFKSLRGKFTNILNHHLKPEDQFYLKKLASLMNWKKRHSEHERRMFNEKQRLGLYKAMNKHNIYPNYWIFTKLYDNELKNVDFFDFMQTHCRRCDNNIIN